MSDRGAIRIRYLALAGALALSAAGTVGYRTIRATVVADAGIELRRFAKSVVESAESTLASSAADVRFLADLPPMRFALDDPGARGLAADAFIAFMKSHADALQVRLLDAHGTELVRVDQRDGAIRPATQFQDKSRRYYFIKAMGLGPRDVYTSRIDLNVEHGKIERPILPVVRFAAPIRNSMGEPQGVVVVNRDGRTLLASVRRWARETSAELVLIDDSGTYLVHREEGRLFGADTMLATGANMSQDDPAALRWALEHPHPSTQIADGRILATATVRSLDGRPRVILLDSERDAVARSASEFGLLIAWLGAASVAYIAGLFGVRRRRLAVAQRAQAVADARSTTLTQAAAALAHEMRNPLAAIVNSAGLLQQEEGVDADSERLLAIVRSESSRLERTLDDFVELARPRAPRATRVDIERLVSDLIVIARQDPRFDDAIRLEQSIGPRIPAVEADPDQLRQVLWNLVRNAGDASKRGGGDQVIVRASRGTIDGSAAAMIEIIDDGPGPIDPADDRAGPARGGLGLIIATGIVARLGGRLELAGRPPPHRGAIATVTLRAMEEGS